MFCKRHGISHDAILNALTSIRGGQRITSQDPEGPTRAWRNMAVT